MSDSDRLRDRGKKRPHGEDELHDASSDVDQETEITLLDDTSVTKTVTMPVSDFDAMKRQNERILAELTRFFETAKKPDDTSEAKRAKPSSSKRASDTDMSRKARYKSDSEEGEVTDYDDEGEQVLTQKRFKNSEDLDLDERVNRLVNLNQNTLDTSKNDDLDLKDIAQEYENEEDVGPKINTDLGEVILTMFKGKMSDEKLKEKIAKHRRPENCKIMVPRVNSEIWDIMDHSAKSKDLRAQSIQKTLLRAVCALASVTDTCLADKDAVAKSRVKDLMDAIGLVLKASSDISVDRRAQIVTAPQVNRKYRKLLSTEIPVTDKLFGDDLKNVCATIDSTSKLGQNFTQSVKGREFFPHAKNWDSQYYPRGRGRARSAMYYPQRGRTRGYQRGRGRNFLRRSQD
ncbi:uncharacterized protein [Littorina saxatilis]|uniref:uncharacterized protein n=1 Tax=Littorina saxatilis TaxID=31220 RepID=UPI0038B6A6FA